MCVAGDSPGPDDDVRPVDGIHRAARLVHSNLHGGIRQPARDFANNRHNPRHTNPCAWALSVPFTWSYTWAGTPTNPGYGPALGHRYL